MAIDAFIVIKDAPGESTDSQYKSKQAIDMLQWSWGLSQSGGMITGQGLGAGKVSPQDFSFTHFLDKASPNLMKLCSTGKHIPEANIVMRLAGEKQLEYIKIKLEEVLVSNVSISGSGSGSDKAIENVTLKFVKVKLDYFPQTDKGALAGAVPYGYDFAANKPL